MNGQKMIGAVLAEFRTFISKAVETLEATKFLI